MYAAPEGVEEKATADVRVYARNYEGTVLRLSMQQQAGESAAPTPRSSQGCSGEACGGEGVPPTGTGYM